MVCSTRFGPDHRNVVTVEASKRGLQQQYGKNNSVVSYN